MLSEELSTEGNQLERILQKSLNCYFNGPDALMITPTGSEKSLTFHIAPIVLDFFKHGERDIVIFAQV